MLLRKGESEVRFKDFENIDKFLATDAPLLQIRKAEICYSKERKGHPLTGLNFYDENGIALLKLGRDGYQKKTIMIDEDERIIGFRSHGKFMDLQATHTNF